jgi:chemotaxis protein histidine kinase CheA
MIGVVIHQVLQSVPLVVSFEKEALDSDLILKILEHAHRLVGKAVNFGLSEVKPVVVPGEDVVDEHKDSDHKDNDHKQIAGV